MAEKPARVKRAMLAGDTAALQKMGRAGAKKRSDIADREETMKKHFEERRRQEHIRLSQETNMDVCPID